MNHFFAKPENISGNEIIIDGDDVNHLKNVLRIKTNDKIRISSGENIDYLCVITKIEPDKIIAGIIETDSKGKELPSKIYLFQGVPKADKMELIIQKCVELGVYEIIPTVMKRCVVKIDKKKEDNKLKRWNGISESAAKQSKRSIIPAVHEVLDFQEAIEYAAALDVLLLPYECAKGMKKTKEIIAGIEPGKSIGIFIGPEGGFDGEELSLAVKAGFEVITLGKRILRTETAGIVMLSVLMFELEQ